MIRPDLVDFVLFRKVPYDYGRLRTDKTVENRTDRPTLGGNSKIRWMVIDGEFQNGKAACLIKLVMHPYLLLKQRRSSKPLEPKTQRKRLIKTSKTISKKAKTVFIHKSAQLLVDS